MWLIQWCCSLLGLLKLLCPLDGVCLVLGPPLGHLGIGFGEGALQLGLGLVLFLQLFTHQVAVMAGGLQSMGQGILRLMDAHEDQNQELTLTL